MVEKWGVLHNIWIIRPSEQKDACFDKEVPIRLGISVAFFNNVAVGDEVSVSCEAYNLYGQQIFTTKRVIKIVASYPPANLSISNVTQTSCRMTWSRVSQLGITYNIYQSINGGPYTIVSKVSGYTTYTLSNLCPNTNYSFYITASNKDGESSPSNTVSINTPAFEISGPDAVCSLSEFILNGATTNVKWTLSSNLKSYYGGKDFIAVAPNGVGQGYVNASIILTGCPTPPIPTKYIYVGIPETPQITFVRDGNGCEYYAYTPNYVSLTYYWSIDGVNWIKGDNKFYGGFMGGKTATIYLKVVNSCGTSPISVVTKYLPKPSNCMW